MPENSLDPTPMPSQLDVISLADGMARTNNWRQAIKGQFGNDPDNVPCGFFISLVDLQEIVETYKDHMKDGQKKPCVGARVYFTLPNAIEPGKSIPKDQIAGVLVPCYLDHDFSKPVITPIYRDILVKVDSVTVKDAYSIYDVTRPCPPMCDDESELR